MAWTRVHTGSDPPAIDGWDPSLSHYLGPASLKRER